MNKNLIIKAILLSLFVIWVGNGNASFDKKSCKPGRQTKTSQKVSEIGDIHFAPLDVVKW